MQAGGRGFESHHLHKRLLVNRIKPVSPPAGVQVSKGPGWMPRLPEPTKGVQSCEKPGGGARAVDARMPEWGNLTGAKPVIPPFEREGIPAEAKHFSRPRKGNQSRRPE